MSTTPSTRPQHATRNFPAEARVVAQARRFTRTKLAEWDATDMVDTAALMVSELLTNAVVHAGTPVRLDLMLEPGSLRIEVEDHHPARAVPVAPALPNEDSEHGRGLMITTSLASSWGVEYTQGAKRVWARCDRDVPASPHPHPFVHAGLDEAPLPRVGVVEVAESGVVTGWNDDATELFGWTAAETVGRRFHELVAPVPGQRPPTSDSASPTAPWQGTYHVLGKDGTSTEVFASHAVGRADRPLVALLVPSGLRSLLEHPAPPRAVNRAETDPLGLRDDALLRMGIDDYLTLAAERVRDRMSADAAYLLLYRDFDDAFEVVAASGLPEEVVGSRVERGAAGTPDRRTPRLPVVMRDVSDAAVPLLAGTRARSLVVVPVVVEGRVVGAIGAASEHPQGFSEQQSTLLQRSADTLALVTDRARLQVSERERRGWLSFVAEAGDLLAGSLDQSMTMAITGQIVVPRIATWCAVYLDDERRHPRLQHLWHTDEEHIDDLRDALLVGTPVASDSSDLVGGDCIVTIPLVARGRRIGVLVLGRPEGEPLRNELMLVAESVARRAALAIDNAAAHGELQKVGETLQRSLLPHAMPEAPGLDVGVVYEAAGERMAAGGDFYDLFPVAGGRWCFVIGDVCGAGAEAAAVTGLARHTIRALTNAGFPVAATLERLNTAILEEGPRSRFLTLVCGLVHDAGGPVSISLVNAGHPPPYVVSGDGSVRHISGPQALLGVIDNVSYVAEDLVLDRGDLLVAVTDGVLERRDGNRMLDDSGVAEALATVARLPAQAVAERIRHLVMDFTDEPPHDDMAVLTLRVL